MEPQLIERDGSLFVVNKPAGLPVHPTADKAELSLTKWIRDTFGHDVAPIHRLDRDTSGVVLPIFRPGRGLLGGGPSPRDTSKKCISRMFSADSLRRAS